MLTEAQKRAMRKYDAKTTQLCIRFIRGADDDIIERLRSVPCKADYIRRLVRSDIG